MATSESVVLNIAATPENFDEDAYLRANPDVAQAVRTGSLTSGWHHFETHGHKEGRYLSLQRRVIHVDHPTDMTAVPHGQVFDGWSVSPDPRDSISIAVNGRSVESYQVSRPDVQRVYPDLCAKGWMFFFEPSGQDTEYIVVLTLADVTREVRFTISEQVLEMAAVFQFDRKKHLDFLKEILVCSTCRVALPDLSDLSGKEWQCGNCGERYDCSSGLNLIPKSYVNYDAISFNGAIYSHGYDGDVENLISEVRAGGGMVLDCGAGWRPSIRDNVVTTEILRYPSTDVVAVSEHLPFRDASFDAVLSLHVLEHVKNPFVCAAELIRVLKPHGRFLAVIPYVVAVHGAPFHFFNPTPQGLCALFENFAYDTKISVPRASHPFIALKDLIEAYYGFLEQSALATFSNITIGEFAKMTREEILDSDLVRGFREDGMMYMSGNYMITGYRS